MSRFHEDEPETLHYIDNVVKDGEIFWDIGANVGLYSLYAAKRGVMVYAFEPSAFNFSLLVEHIRLNGLSEKIKPFCIAFSDADGLADLNMSDVEAGHASNSIGEAANQHNKFQSAFTQSVIAMKIDSFVAHYGVMPDHIKLDVDGLEPLILEGGSKTLKTVKSLIIEIEGKNAEADSPIRSSLEKAGLVEDKDFAKLGKTGRNCLFVRG